MKYTIDELVSRVKPDYVSINNPTSGGKTLGSALVSSFHVDVDPADGLMMYITLEEDPMSNLCKLISDAENEIKKAKQKLDDGPHTQYEIWPANDSHAGYPKLVTDDREIALKYYKKGYEIREYTAYPVI